jgi:hypothetical protein
MCHLIRDEEFERRRAQASLPPKEMPSSPRPRRLAGAVAAAVAAGVVAVVALLFPASTPAVSKAAPAAPVAVEQTTGGLDDGVPATTASRASHCNHEL